MSALWALALLGCATPGKGDAPVSSHAAAAPLSNFDYVVLASLADAGRPISLATYTAVASSE